MPIGAERARATPYGSKRVMPLHSIKIYKSYSPSLNPTLLNCRAFTSSYIYHQQYGLSGKRLRSTTAAGRRFRRAIQICVDQLRTPCIRFIINHPSLLTSLQRIAHEKVEQQRRQLDEQERQVAQLRARIALLEGGVNTSISGLNGNTVDDFSIKVRHDLRMLHPKAPNVAGNTCLTF